MRRDFEAVQSGAAPRRSDGGRHDQLARHERQSQHGAPDAGRQVRVSPAAPIYSAAEVDVLRQRYRKAEAERARCEIIDFVAINRFRDSLPQHRQLWFDALSLTDQARLALPYALQQEYAADRSESRETTGGPGA